MVAPMGFSGSVPAIGAKLRGLCQVSQVRREHRIQQQRLPQSPPCFQAWSAPLFPVPPLLHLLPAQKILSSHWLESYCSALQLCVLWPQCQLSILTASAFLSALQHILRYQELVVKLESTGVSPIGLGS